MLETVAHKTTSRESIADSLAKNFDKLPELDQKFFMYGPVYLGVNGGFAGLIANSLYRRALNVTQAFISSSLPMAVLPFMTTYVLYNATVSSPLLSGDLHCPTCVLIRGGLVGVIGGALYPIALALPANMGLASMYSTAPMPEKGNVLRFWMDLSKPIFRKMRAVMLLQAIFGTFLASRHYEGYTKLAKITFGRHAEERNH
ncbi:transmembrane protein 126A [Stigmatopora argus]